MPEARRWIISVARGHPFYVHLLGKHALIKTMEDGGRTITDLTAKKALEEIALKGAAPIQESAYKTAIGHSYIRECILAAFASVPDEEIHTTEVYANMAKTLEVDPATISVYVGQLASDKFGRVLEKTRERYYRFRDSLFKAYAAARPWQFSPGHEEDEPGGAARE